MAKRSSTVLARTRARRSGEKPFVSSSKLGFSVDLRAWVFADDTRKPDADRSVAVWPLRSEGRGETRSPEKNSSIERLVVCKGDSQALERRKAGTRSGAGEQSVDFLDRGFPTALTNARWSYPVSVDS